MWLEQISLYVNDPIATRDFFVEKLGFGVASECISDEVAWIELQAPGSEGVTISLVPPSMPAGGSEKIGGFSGISFATDDMTGLHKRLTDRGVTVSEPKREDYGRYLMVLFDLDGNEFFIFQDV